MKIFVFLFGSRNREASTTIESVLVSTRRCSSSLLGIIEMGKASGGRRSRSRSRSRSIASFPPFLQRVCHLHSNNLKTRCYFLITLFFFFFFFFSFSPRKRGLIELYRDSRPLRRNWEKTLVGTFRQPGR